MTKRHVTSKNFETFGTHLCAFGVTFKEYKTSTKQYGMAVGRNMDEPDVIVAHDGHVVRCPVYDWYPAHTIGCMTVEV